MIRSERTVSSIYIPGDLKFWLLVNFSLLHRLFLLSSRKIRTRGFSATSIYQIQQITGFRLQSIQRAALAIRTEGVKVLGHKEVWLLGIRSHMVT